MTCTGENCNDNPIIICTSLPPDSNGNPTPTKFDTECRELADAMCRAVVRTIEQYRVEKKGKLAQTGIPSGLYDWVLRVKNGDIPDCLDPDEVSNILGQSMNVDTNSLSGHQLANAQFVNRTSDFVQSFGASATSFDIDDWHDD